MHRTPPLFRRGLAVSAAAVLLTACGGDDGGDSASSSAASSGPAHSSEHEEAIGPDSEFCTQSRELLDGLGAAFTEQPDSSSVEDVFQQAADGFRRIEPPSEIEEDWVTLSDGLEEYAVAFSELDESDPDSVSRFQERTASLQGGLTTAATNVESYLNEQCGIDTDEGTTESSAPTS
jgi:hypothetical protein